MCSDGLMDNFSFLLFAKFHLVKIRWNNLFFEQAHLPWSSVLFLVLFSKSFHFAAHRRWNRYIFVPALCSGLRLPGLGLGDVLRTCSCSPKPLFSLSAASVPPELFFFFRYLAPIFGLYPHLSPWKVEYERLAVRNPWKF